MRRTRLRVVLQPWFGIKHWLTTAVSREQAEELSAISENFFTLLSDASNSYLATDSYRFSRGDVEANVVWLGRYHRTSRSEVSRGVGPER